MDRRMPIMNGDVATAELRQLGVTVPIIGLTGDAHRDDMTSFKAMGVNEVLTCTTRLMALMGRAAHRSSPSPWRAPVCSSSWRTIYPGRGRP
jgi:CheY-like chemotaxis protein